MAYIFGSIWDRFNRNALNDLSKSVEYQGKSIQELVAEGQLTPAQYAQLVSIVNGNVKKGKIIAEDIDKNNFKLDQTYMTDSLLQMMTGNTPVNSVPADRSITTEKLEDGAANVDKVTKNIATGMLLKTNHNNAVLNFDFVNKKIEVTGAARIYHQNGSYLIDESYSDISFGHLTGNNEFLIYYDTSKNVIGFSEQHRVSSTEPIPDDGIVIGSFNPRFEQVNGFYHYTINGAEEQKDQIGLLIGQANQVTFDTVDKTLTLANTRLLHGGLTTYTYYKVLDFSEFREVIYNLYYDLSTGELGAVEYNQTIPKTAIVFAAFSPNMDNVMHIPEFNIDGKVYKYNSSSDSEPFKNAFFSGLAEDLNFDFRNKRIIVGGRARLISDKVNHPIEPQILDISHAYADGGNAIAYIWGVYYDISDDTMSVKGQAQLPTENEVLFASFDPTSQQVNNVENCYINGKPRRFLLSVRDQDFYVENLKQSELYSSPTLDNAGEGATYDIENLQSSEVYSLYDDLMTDYPEYITRTSLKSEMTGQPIYRYDLRPPKVKDLNYEAKMPKIFLASGTHGHEKTAVWSTYQAIKQICENWSLHDVLEELRWNVHLIIVPIVNPWGIDRFIKQNSNGVDINRSFPDGWLLRDESRIDYGGTYPLSEVEAQNISDILLNEENLIFFVDHHNFQSNPDENRFLWTPVFSPFALTLGKTFISSMSRKWKPEYSFLPQNDTEYFGDANIGVKTTTYAYGTYIGIHSAIFETKESMPYETDSKWYSSLTITLATESLINYLYLILKNKHSL